MELGGGDGAVSKARSCLVSQVREPSQRSELREKAGDAGGLGTGPQTKVKKPTQLEPQNTPPQSSDGTWPPSDKFPGTEGCETRSTVARLTFSDSN